MTYQEAMAQAKGNMGKCKACPVCNGLACRNTQERLFGNLPQYDSRPRSQGCRRYGDPEL